MNSCTTHDIIDLIAQHWGLDDVGLYYSFQQRRIFTAIRATDQLPVMVKVNTDTPTLLHEMIALQTFQGNGCVQLLDTAPSFGALLLERLLPGNSLETFFPEYDVKAIAHAATVMHELHQATVPPNLNLPTLADWLDRLIYSPSPELPTSLVTKAQQLAVHLLTTMAPSVVLHGDLHHNNILAAGNTWVAIDPHGVIGEPLYEVGAFVRNPVKPLLQQSNLQAIIRKRLTIFSALMNASRQRVAAWSFVQALLAAQWATEENADPTQWLTVAAILEAEISDLLVTLAED
ncbi:hypothetical protein FJ365_03630 [Candidatus Dependentiae bacterium]|nr:hypothetical protein [Candidatus Dependentiae bacterium]